MDDIALLFTETNDSPADPDPEAVTPTPEPAPTACGDLDDDELTAWLDLAG